MKCDDRLKVKAVIFDLDGTLIDTEKVYRKVWPEAMKKLGFDFSDEQYLELRSLGRPFAPAKFREWYGDDFNYDEARAVRKTLFDAYIAMHPIEQKRGTKDLIDYLKNKGIVTAVATATDIKRAEEYITMAGLDGMFDKVISATMVDEGKPSKKVYEYAVETLGFAPFECVAVEDAPNGILSAYRAGLKVIMVPDQSPVNGELQKMLYACVESLDEIMKLV